MKGCLKNYVCSCCAISLCPIYGRNHGVVVDESDAVEFQNGFLWSHDLGHHSAGDFSHAVMQANAVIEDHSHVDTADGAFFVGVYDGHGGDSAAKFVSDNLFTRFNALARVAHSINATVLRDTFAGTETDFLNAVRQRQADDPGVKLVGSCCLVGVIWRGRLYVANAGDSRVVIGRKCPSGGLCAEQLTKDDNANRSSVRKQLQAENPNDPHIVSYANGSWRVKGHIQVSKSIGDAYLKHRDFALPLGYAKHIHPPLSRAALSAEPNVHVRDLHSNDQFLIFASDGLWDLLSNGRAVEIVHNNPRNGIARKLIREAIKVAAVRNGVGYQTLQQHPAGIRRNFHDDISVVVVYLDARVAGQDSPVPEPVQIRAFAQGVLPARFDIEGIN